MSGVRLTLWNAANTSEIAPAQLVSGTFEGGQAKPVEILLPRSDEAVNVVLDGTFADGVRRPSPSLTIPATAVDNRDIQARVRVLSETVAGSTVTTTIELGWTTRTAGLARNFTAFLSTDKKQVEDAVQGLGSLAGIPVFAPVGTLSFAHVGQGSVFVGMRDSLGGESRVLRVRGLPDSSAPMFLARDWQTVPGVKAPPTGLAVYADDLASTDGATPPAPIATPDGTADLLVAGADGKLVCLAGGGAGTWSQVAQLPSQSTDMGFLAGRFDAGRTGFLLFDQFEGLIGSIGEDNATFPVPSTTRVTPSTLLDDFAVLSALAVGRSDMDEPPRLSIAGWDGGDRSLRGDSLGSWMEPVLPSSLGQFVNQGRIRSLVVLDVDGSGGDQVAFTLDGPTGGHHVQDLGGSQVVLLSIPANDGEVLTHRRTVVRDLGSDGDLDILVARLAGNQVALRWWDSNPTSSPWADVTVRDNWALTSGDDVQVSAADLDLDGCEDLVVFLPEGTIDVLWGTRDSSSGLQDWTSFSFDSRSRISGLAVYGTANLPLNTNCAAGDFDGDGDVDLAVFAADSGGDLRWRIVENQTSLTTAPEATLDLVAATGDQVLGVTPQGHRLERTAAGLQLATPTYVPGTTFRNGRFPATSLGALNDVCFSPTAPDGAELVGLESGLVGFLRRAGYRGVTTGYSFANIASVPGATRVLPAVLDADRHNNYITINSSTAWWVRGTSDPVHVTQVNLPPASIDQLATDRNGDGITDLLVATASGVTVFNGPNSTAGASFPGLGAVSAIAAGQLFGKEGVASKHGWGLAVATPSGAPNGDQLQLFDWDGGVVVATIAAPGIQKLAIGDLTGDGRPEIVAASATTLFVFQLERTSSGWQIAVLKSIGAPVSGVPTSLQVVRVDADWRQELVASYVTNGSFFYSFR